MLTRMDEIAGKITSEFSSLCIIIKFVINSLWRSALVLPPDSVSYVRCNHREMSISHHSPSSRLWVSRLASKSKANH